MTVTAFSFFRFDGAQQLWAFSQMALARLPLLRLKDLQFHKLMGSGTRDGFFPVPNTHVYSIMTVWPSLGVAREHIQNAAIFRRYRDHAVEDYTIYLSGSQCRGQWAGQSPFMPERPEDVRADNDYVAILTRASVKAQHALSFWRQVPGISTDIEKQDRLLFKIGVGEVPWLHQVTFTVWDDVQAMEAFAYKGFHGAAIEEVRRGGWFKEELFARFHVLHAEGVWEGRAPLSAFGSASTPMPEPTLGIEAPA